jgi:hypothetical protein
MAANSAPSILIAVRHRSLYDALAQMLAACPVSLRLLPVATLAEIRCGILTGVDLVIADPFLLQESISSEDFRALRRLLGSVPLILLLPADTHEYREIAVDLDANGSVVIEEAAVDLLPTVMRLLSPPPAAPFPG